MARKNASNLDNQISLLDMMVSESPEYSEEKPKENQEISENAKNDTEQTGEPSHPKTSKPAKARASISTQTLKVVKALYTDTVETNWEDLFDGFDRLYAITFSSGIEFVNKVINKFSYAEVVFGCEKSSLTTLLPLCRYKLTAFKGLQNPSRQGTSRTASMTGPYNCMYRGTRNRTRKSLSWRALTISVSESSPAVRICRHRRFAASSERISSASMTRRHLRITRFCSRPSRRPAQTMSPIRQS